MSNLPTLVCPVSGEILVDALAAIPPELLKQKVLDHGFVNVIDVMPRLVPLASLNCDFALAEAARLSYQKGTKKVNEDAALVDYLIRNKHTSPVEMGEIKYHVRLPIFVMRQLVRHRTAALNEESARYSELASDFYIPDIKHWAINTAANKQAGVQVMPGGLGAFTEKQAEFLCDKLRKHGELSYELYQLLLGERGEICSGDNEAKLWAELGVPAVAREQARMVLGVNIYTQCYWKQDLKNLFHLLQLRTDAHAQFEIRCFGDPMARVASALFPAAWASWKDNFVDGINFSRKELGILFSIIGPMGSLTSGAAELVKQGWTKRRVEEFVKKMEKSQLIRQSFAPLLHAYDDFKANDKK